MQAIVSRLSLTGLLVAETVLTLVHVNADLWTSKVSHQKFLDVSICWKADTDLKTTLLEVTL
jgi:hypothetical protein